MGLSTAEAFDNIVTGIGRMSPMILDNLGIVVNAEQANAAYAATLGKAASALSEVEKKQALVNAVISSSAGIVAASAAGGEDPASQFERMDTSVKNLKESLGKLIAVPVANFFGEIAGKITEFNEGMEREARRVAEQKMWDFGPAVARAAADIQRLQAIIETAKLGGDGTLLAEASIGLDQLIGRVREYANIYNMAAAATGAPLIDIEQLKNGIVAFQGLTPAIGAASIAQQQAAATAMSEAAAMDQLRAAVQRVQAAHAQLEASIRGAAQGIALNASKSIGAEASLQLYRDIIKQLTDYRDQLGLAGRSEEEINFLVEVRKQKLTDQYQTIYDTTAALKEQGTAVSDINKEFDDLKGKVAGVLSGALDTGTGVDPKKLLESMGLREDAINEDARRLAAIAMEGFTGQSWMEEFKKNQPDMYAALAAAGDPKAAAAKMLLEFQEGLHPELIDKEKAKELVKTLIKGDQNMAALAQEIATELAAEMGVPLATALAAAQTGLGVSGGGADAGSSAATEFGQGAIDGITSEGKGAAMVTTFVAQMRTVYAQARIAGKDAGGEWGGGFLETVGLSVPVALIQLLVGLVTPGVMAAIAQHNTQTGAAP